MPRNAQIQIWKSRNDLWRVSVSGFTSHPTMLRASPTQLLVGQLTRLPFYYGYATTALFASTNALEGILTSL